MSESGFRIAKTSSLYETEPVGMPGAVWFYNRVVEVETDLEPEEVLRWIKKTERDLGRIGKGRLKPRIIDIDILLAEARVVQTEALVIPHPRLAERKFVLVPLSEIAPYALHPVLHLNINNLLENSRDNSRVDLIQI